MHPTSLGVTRSVSEARVGRFVTLSALVMLVSGNAADAQVLDAEFRADSGTVVRFHLASGRTQVGKLLAPFAADSVVWRFCHYPAPTCRPDGQRYAELLPSELHTIDLHLGTRAGTGALIGGFLGASFAILALMQSDDSDMSTGGALVAGLSVSGFLTAGGVLLGGLFHRWQPPSGNVHSPTSAWSLTGARGVKFLEVVTPLPSRGTNDACIQWAYRPQIKR